MILEPAFGAYGTDMRDTNVGLPGMSLMPSLTTGATVASSGSSSSLNLSQTNRQDAVVKAILYRLRRQDRPPGLGIGLAARTRRACATTSSWAPARTA